MSIKPVDFQVMLPKTSEISKIHNDDQHKNQLLQQQQAVTVQNKAEDQLRQVYSQDKANEARIREKQEKNREKNKKEKKKNNGNYGGSKEIQSDGQTSTIDIKL